MKNCEFIFLAGIFWCRVIHQCSVRIIKINNQRIRSQRSVDGELRSASRAWDALNANYRSVRSLTTSLWARLMTLGGQWNGNLLFRCKVSKFFAACKHFKRSAMQLSTVWCSICPRTRDFPNFSLITAFFFAHCKQLLWKLCLQCRDNFLRRFFPSSLSGLWKLRWFKDPDTWPAFCSTICTAPAQLSKKSHYSQVHHS